MTRYDRIIVGGGTAGLTAGLALARRGKRVIILEQHTAVGGYVSSFARKGFRFDGGAGCYSSGGIIFPVLGALGLKEAVPSVRIGFSVVIGGRTLTLSSPESVIEGLGSLFPGSRDDLARYFRRLAPLYRLMALFVRHGGFAERWTGYLPLSLAVLGRPSIWASMLREKGKNSTDLIASTIRDPALGRVIEALGYPVMSVSAVAGMWYAMAEDYWYPLGGLQVMADALAEAFRRAGGELRLGSRVEAILVGEKGAEGVRLEGGEVLKGEAVVSAADLSWTYSAVQTPPGARKGPEDSGGAALSALRRRLETSLPSESFFTTYVGLRMTPEEIARHAACACLIEDPSDPAGQPLTLYLTSRADPSAAPEGHASLTLHEFASYEKWAGLAESSRGNRGPGPVKRPAAYREAKAEAATRAIARAQGVIAGLGERIVVQDAATPVTYERYTGNRAGASVGWNWDPRRRPVSGFRGPIPGLLTVGHWTYSPGGIPTALITGLMVGRRL
jgi:phytoene dehydrogenase-like protein